ITGRFLKTSSVKPSVRTQARCRKLSRSRRPNQFALLYMAYIIVIRMTVSLIYDPIYLRHNTGQHPENAHRLEVILEVLRDSDIAHRLENVQPKPAAMEDLERCH